MELSCDSSFRKWASYLIRDPKKGRMDVILVGMGRDGKGKLNLTTAANCVGFQLIK